MQGQGVHARAVAFERTARHGGESATVAGGGNPAAAVVTFAAVVRPLLARLAGAEMKPPLTFAVVSAFPHSKKPERQEWLRVSLKAAPGGGWLAERFPQSGAGILSSLAATDGFAILPESLTTVAPGDRLSFLPYSEVAA